MSKVERGDEWKGLGNCRDLFELVGSKRKKGRRASTGVLLM